MYVITLAGFVVVAHEASAFATAVEAVLVSMRPVRARPGQRPDHTFDDRSVREHLPKLLNLSRSHYGLIYHSFGHPPSFRKEGPETLGIILTGMGSDGARGLRAMKMAGVYTIAQDEKSCVVFGTSEQAIRLGQSTGWPRSSVLRIT